MVPQPRGHKHLLPVAAVGPKPIRLHWFGEIILAGVFLVWWWKGDQVNWPCLIRWACLLVGAIAGQGRGRRERGWESLKLRVEWKCEAKELLVSAVS